MAQTDYTPIQLYSSSTASAVPMAGNLASGELAINTADEKLYFKNSAGTVKLLAANVTPVANGGTGATSLSSVTVGAATNLASGSNGTIPYQSASGTTAMLATGTAGQVLTSGGVGAPTWTTQAGGFTNMAIVTATGNWTVPAGVTKVKVTVVGGGGGSGSISSGTASATCAAGGGGGGATSIGIVTGLTPGGTVAVTIGAGGTGGTSGNNGGNGGTSSFGTYVLADGGSGSGGLIGPGTAITITRGGVGGTINAGGTSAVIKFGGQAGCNGTAAGAMSLGGQGGSSMLGGGAHGGSSATNTSGIAATQYGAGAGGGNRVDATVIQGAAGAAGVVIIEY